MGHIAKENTTVYLIAMDVYTENYSDTEINNTATLCYAYTRRNVPIDAYF